MIMVSITEILAPKNLNESIKHIVKKNTTPGLGKIDSTNFPEFWEKEGRNIINLIHKGNYKPGKALRIPKKKENQADKVRVLEIPNLLDRVLLNAITKKLEPAYRKTFSKFSFGFISGRGTKDALKRGLLYINEGYRYIAKIDIEGFFDNVNHEVLIKKLEDSLYDKKVLALIKKYLNQQVTDYTGRVCYIKHRGLCQGSPLSPLLANIVLNEADMFFEKMKYRFVRYADDIFIFCNNKESALAAIQCTKAIIEERLLLRLNMDKTVITTPEKVNFLGYSFEKNGNVYIPIVSGKAIKKLHDNINKCINRIALDDIVWFDRIGAFNRGWINYFRYANNEQLNQITKEAEYLQVFLLLQAFKSPQIKNQQKHDFANILESKNFKMMTEWVSEIEERNYKL